MTTPTQTRTDRTVRLETESLTLVHWTAALMAAIAVSPGTDLTWEWTGKGGTHNVVAETGGFDSGKLVSKQGHTFAHTFEQPGIYKYVCEPHRSLGMRGAVFVALEV